ncbi:MAG TPA: hypothetical protein VFQ56_05185, partial [Flavobacterium sp.]|nr:hypothetical protein [Flavobacterium sp.]
LTYNNLTLENVAEYDTVNKVFLMGMTLFNVAISVFWAEISHAKAQKNKAKLIELFNQLLLIALGFTICALLFSYFIPQIILIWTKGMIKVQYSQIIPFLLLLAVQSFAYVGAVILNAYEELKWQILLSLFSAILIIPLAKLFFNLKFGIGTVPLASAILVTPTLIYALIKAKSVINQV